MSETPIKPKVNTSLPGWAKIMLALAVLVAAAGIALPYFAPPAPAQGSLSSLATSLGENTGFTQKHWSQEWSPAIFRLGFSFVVGFAIAYALRWALKTALFVGGVLALAVLGLQYSGLVDVKWGLIEQQYDGAASWLSRQTQDFSAFLKGALPSAGAGAAGLFAGLRKVL
jgi:uncharacterized membrane protein (Fun14 family)